MLPAHNRHSGVGKQPPAHICNVLHHTKVPRLVTLQPRHQHTSSARCGELPTSARVLQQADRACQQPSRCSPLACQSIRNGSSRCIGASSGGLCQCAGAARHLPTNSNAGRGRLQHNQHLFVVALDRDGHHSEDCEDYEQPPESGSQPLLSVATTASLSISSSRTSSTDQ